MGLSAWINTAGPAHAEPAGSTTAVPAAGKAWVAAAVREHAGLVYFAAVRRVGDAHLAEDVTQAVFLVLAKKPRSAARSAERSGSLAGWLLKTTRYAAANALKRQRRRAHHERQFALQHPAATTQEATMSRAWPSAAGTGALASSNPSEVLYWLELAPLLDDAVLALPATDRAAVLLRFFEDQPTAEVASRLGVSEEAARQRLSRAIRKLRQILERKGLSLSAATLGTLLVAHTVHAAPTRLIWTTLAATARTSTAAGATAGATSAAAAIAKATIAMMHLAKLKLAAVIIAATGLAGAAALSGGAFVNDAIAQAGAAAQPQRAAQPSPATGEAQEKTGDPRFSVASNPPVVVMTWPRAGNTRVDPALKEIRIVFSKPMKPENFSFAQVSDDSFPRTLGTRGTSSLDLPGRARYIPEENAFSLPVVLEPNRYYVIRLNFPPYDRFMDTAGNKALPYLLVFETAASSEAADRGDSLLQRVGVAEEATTRPVGAVRKVDPNDPVFQRARPMRDALFGFIAQADKAGSWPADLAAATTAGLDTSKLPGTLRYVRPKDAAPAADLPVLFESLEWPQDLETRRGVWIGYADGTVQLISDAEKFKQLKEKSGV